MQHVSVNTNYSVSFLAVSEWWEQSLGVKRALLSLHLSRLTHLTLHTKQSQTKRSSLMWRRTQIVRKDRLWGETLGAFSRDMGEKKNQWPLLWSSFQAVEHNKDKEPPPTCIPFEKKTPPNCTPAKHRMTTCVQHAAAVTLIIYLGRKVLGSVGPVQPRRRVQLACFAPVVLKFHTRFTHPRFPTFLLSSQIYGSFVFLLRIVDNTEELGENFMLISKKKFQCNPEVNNDFKSWTKMPPSKIELTLPFVFNIFTSQHLSRKVQGITCVLEQSCRADIPCASFQGLDTF